MNARPCTVLVVDDEAALRRVLARHLDREGYRVLEASTGESAYELITADRPDAILLDVHLPAMSGLALYLTIIHRWPELDGRIAIMSGDADAEQVQVWLERHNCPVIRKPFNLHQITGWLREMLAWRNRSRGNASG
ncbi:MAG TPA: response regulator [Gemmatimonadales bacterium]|nr:response regulator [Gemmatimonadales bacterium]